MCQFKMTLEAYPLLDAGNIYIDFTLLHNGGRLARGEKEVIGDVEFEVGERCRFRLDAI